MIVSTIDEAKTNLSRLIARAEKGEEVVIARGKQPVVRLVPVMSSKSLVDWPEKPVCP